MSHLEKFAEGVADDVGRAAPSNDTDLHGAVDWAALIEMVISLVMSMIGGCGNNDSRIRHSVQQPTRLQRAYLLTKVKSSCECCGVFGRFRGDVKMIADSMASRAAAMPEADLTEMIGEARGFENSPF